MEKFVDDIIVSLKEYADLDRIEFAKRSYPTKMEVIGVTVPDLKSVLKEVKILTKKLSAEEKLELAKELIDRNVFECQQLAFEYLGNDRKALSRLTEKIIDELGQNLDNWVSIDYYAALIVGYAWREKIIGIDKIKSYLKSRDFWIRRIALVATVSLNQKARGGTGDSKQTLEICKLVVDDHEDMINKALSWALRELSKIEKEPVIEFVDQYKYQLHKRVFREVTHKLEMGTKN